MFWEEHFLSTLWEHKSNINKVYKVKNVLSWHLQNVMRMFLPKYSYKDLKGGKTRFLSFERI